MSSASRRLLTLGLLSSFVWVGTASAQTDAPPPPAPAPAPEAPPPPPPPPPGKDAKYEFAKVEEVKTVVWKASASAGFSAATGNANILTFSGGGLVSRNDGKNKIQATIDALYGRTSQYTGFDDLNTNGTIQANEPLVSEATETAAFLKGLARYDRFFTANNTIFATFFAGFDNPASKQYFLGGQLGYARQIVKTKMHEMFGEVGGDFTYDYLRAPDPTPMGFNPEVILGSGRLFLGYVLSVSTHTAVRANIETLINFNSLTIGDRAVGVAEATRVNGKLEFTTQIWKPLSFRAAFTARFNNAPAPFAKLPTPIDHPDHYNQKLDTLTELGLVVNFI